MGSRSQKIDIATAVSAAVVGSSAVSNQLSGKVPVTLTINGHALNSDVTITPDDLTQDATHRFATDAEKAAWNAKQTDISPTYKTDGGGALALDTTNYIEITIGATTYKLAIVS